MGLPLPDDHAPRLLRILALDGSFVAEDCGRIVGTLGAYPFDLVAPGDRRVSTAGTTLAGVLPTHRRRGLLRRLMMAHFDWARETARPVAALWSSQTPIYRRFDFGPVTERGEWTIDVPRAGWRGLSAGDDVELVDRDAAVPRLRALYDRHLGERAGALTRSHAWWEVRRVLDVPELRQGASPYLFAFACRDGDDRGYLQYRRTSRWERSHARDRIHVVELVGDAEARRSLWKFALHIDLVETIDAFNLPPDDVVLHLLNDSRRARVDIQDALWMAPLDVRAFLEARGYEEEGELVLGVRRESGSAETVRLVARGGAAAVETSSAEPDVTLSAATLATVAWNGRAVEPVRAAGLIEGSDDAVRALARLLSTDRAPWCPERF